MPSPLGRITIVGLGPGDPGARTIAGQRALDSATRIILRTAIHPGIDDLRSDCRVTSCDDLYEQYESFDDLYPAIVQRIVALAGESDVVYAVPGQSAFGERTVPLLQTRATALGHEVLVTPSVSAIDEIASRLRQDPLSSQVQLLDAPRLHDILNTEPYAAGLLAIDPNRPLLIGQVYSPDLAASVKLVLSGVFPDDHKITVVSAAGVPTLERVESIPLHTLDRAAVDHLTSVWVPALSDLDGVRSPWSVLQIIARLRAPGGCPWDRKQTHASLRDAILDEAYEAVDAIDNGDLDNLAEELGDLLLLITLHSQIATEDGHFTIEDVFEALTSKLIRRHPHVFGDVEAATPAEVVTTWNRVKAQERGGKPQKALYDKLPRAMPAMPRAIALLRDSPPNSYEPLPESTPGDHLLASIWHMIDAGLDPERALNQSLAARYGEPTDPEGDHRP